MSKFAQVLLGLGLQMFQNHFDGADQEWTMWGCQAQEELNTVNNKQWDHYPQGREHVIRFLEQCRDHNQGFRRKAVKTFPTWTWYYETL